MGNDFQLFHFLQLPHLTNRPLSQRTCVIQNKLKKFMHPSNISNMIILFTWIKFAEQILVEVCRFFVHRQKYDFISPNKENRRYILCRYVRSTFFSTICPSCTCHIQDSEIKYYSSLLIRKPSFPYPSKLWSQP